MELARRVVISMLDTMSMTDTTMLLAPRVEARLLQELKVQRHETVLEIGAGSGFVAALLGHQRGFPDHIF